MAFDTIIHDIHHQHDYKKPELLKEYPFIHVQPVAWGEMDAFNHVNNVAYYRYAESARIGYFQATGLMNGRFDLLTILAYSSCQYLKPVCYPDTLLIGVRIKKLGNTSLELECLMFSKHQNAVAAKAEAVIVRTDKSMKKQPWNENERAVLGKFEGRDLSYQESK